jgi:hypothetical protein
MNQPKDLTEWYQIAEPIILTVKTLLEDTLSDAPVALENQLREMATLQGNMATLFSEAQSLTSYARQAAMMDKRAKGLTAVEKRIWIEGETRSEVAVRDLVEGLGKALKDKIILGECLLKGSLGEIARRQ